jgi:acyl-CoA synthetase (AMP-forming)/AMP-acid ligase II
MNVTMLLDMAADGFGDRVVVGDRERGITAGDLARGSLAGAALIRERGADSVIYLAPNGPAFPLALFSAARAGVPLVPLNYRLGSDQLARLLARHPGALLIGDGPRGIPDNCTPQDWLNRALAADAATALDPPEHSATAVIIYTSGTTALPKGVLIQHDNLVSYVLGSVDFMSAQPDETALISLPPYHVAGVANVLTHLFAARRSVVLGQFTPEDWLRTVRAERVSHALVVPTMLARIMERIRIPAGNEAVPSLRHVAYGGAPMPAPVIEAALHAWPEVDFVNAYGLTETSSTIAVLGPADHRAASTSADPAVRARLASVGHPIPGVDLEVRDERGRPLPTGRTGRIHVRGPQVAARYAETGSATDEEGFFDTRDEGHLDADGYLFIAGRADDTIIRGGENIAPAEVEDVLRRHPDVRDVAVVGVPDDEWGHALAAIVVTHAGGSRDPEALRDFARASLRGSKTPDRIVFWEELPRSETGKLIRRDLVARLLP